MLYLNLFQIMVYNLAKGCIRMEKNSGEIIPCVDISSTLRKDNLSRRRFIQYLAISPAIIVSLRVKDAKAFGLIETAAVLTIIASIVVIWEFIDKNYGKTLLSTAEMEDGTRVNIYINNDCIGCGACESEGASEPGSVMSFSVCPVDCITIEVD